MREDRPDITPDRFPDASLQMFTSPRNERPVWHEMVMKSRDCKAYGRAQDEQDCAYPPDGNPPRKLLVLTVQHQQVARENPHIKESAHGDREQHHVENIRRGGD